MTHYCRDWATVNSCSNCRTWAFKLISHILAQHDSEHYHVLLLWLSVTAILPNWPTSVPFPCFTPPTMACLSPNYLASHSQYLMLPLPPLNSTAATEYYMVCRGPNCSPGYSVLRAHLNLYPADYANCLAMARFHQFDGRKKK